MNLQQRIETVETEIKWVYGNMFRLTKMLERNKDIYDKETINELKTTIFNLKYTKINLEKLLNDLKIDYEQELSK